MLLNDEQIRDLHHKYAPNDVVFERVFTHCTIVCEIAEWCVDSYMGSVDRAVPHNACLLHDIGTYILFDEQAVVRNERMYAQHAILGAKILADEGLDEPVWQAVETHVLMGLSKQEIEGRKSNKAWALPAKDYLPKTIEAELLCYADRFHSKHPSFNSYETFLAKLRKNLPIQADRFEQAATKFGLPDLQALASKYKQSIV